MAKESNGRADAGVRAESASNVKTQAEQALLAQQALEAELLKQKQAEEALLAKKEEEEEAVEGDQEAAPAEQAEAGQPAMVSVFAESVDGSEPVLLAESGQTASDATGAGDGGWGLGTWVAIGAGATAAVAFALAGDDDSDPANVAPVSANGNATIAEDGTLNGTLPAATDANNDTVTYSLASPASNGTVTVDANGGYVYTPGANFNGTDSFTFTVSDGKGGENTYTLFINVTSVNDAPVASAVTVAATEEVVLSGQLPAASDVDGDAVTYALGATTPAKGSVVVNANGSYIYTPNANQTGTDTFSYTVSDGNGGSNSYLVTVQIANVNDVPVGANGSATTAEDVVLNGTLPAATDVDGDTLIYALATGPANGTVVVNANGSYSYTPAANFNGNDSFTFTVSDGNGGVVTYTQSITVTAVNDAPVAQDQTLPGIEDTVLNGSVTATDADGDALTFSVAGGGVTANGGTVVMQPNGTFAYTPAAGFSGTDSFTYTVSDGNGGTDTATVTVNVQEVADVFTPGIDLFIGNANDEVFIGTNSNLNAGDSVNGGGGFDVVTHSVDVGGGVLSPNNFAGFIFDNVDRFDITSDAPLNGSSTTYDLSSSSAIGVLRVQNSSNSVVLNNAAAGGIDANTTYLEIFDQTSTTTDVSLDIRDIDATGNNDRVDVTVRSATNTGDALDDLNIDAAVETVTIHTDGPLAVVINDLNTDLGGAAGSGAVNLVLDAQDSALTITNALTANVKNVNGVSSDENLTFSVAAANGNTTLVTGSGNDSVTGSAFADSVTMNAGNDTFNTGAGNDRIDMGAGNDVVNFTGVGNVSVQGGAGSDTINAGTDLTVGDTITGGADADLLNVGANNGTNDLNNVTQVERIVLADINGNYSYVIGSGSAFQGDSTATEVDGSALDAGETLNFNGNSRTGVLTLIGGDGNDTLIGGNGNDVIVGDGDNGDNDGGADILQGGNGDDEFRFDGNELTVADRIHGGFAGDGIGLQRGNDTITLIQDGVNMVGGREVFVLDLDANASIELVKVEDANTNGSSRITDLTVDAGHDQALTNVDATDLDSNEAFDFDATAVVAGRSFSVTSGAGADTLLGGNGNDTIRGGAGNDFINGGAGGNQLFGEDGNDTLVGGNSNDVLDGGTGNDSVDASQGGNDNVALGDGNDYVNFGANGLTNNGGDTVAGGDGIDTVESAHNTPNNIIDGAFGNFSSVEVLNLTGNANSSTTLGTNAQNAGIRTVNLNGTGNDVLNAGGFTADLLVNDNGGVSNDTITTGSGNDTVVTSLGDDSLVLNAGNDVVQISGTDLTFGDSIAAGAGSDKVVMDNTSGAVNAGVNLNNVTGLERYEFLGNGDRFIGVDADNNTLTFTGGNVLTINTITIDASTLTDLSDTFTVTLDAGQLDADFRFEVFGSATNDTFVKNNVGTNNNILFDAGNSNDRLVIHGDDLGSTITMIGGGGTDAIQQTGGLIDDDGYDNVQSVEQLIAGGLADRVNATLGAQAMASGLNEIIGGTGNDVVTFDAAFTTATTVDLRAGATGGNDSINAGMTTALITFLGQDADFDANDTLVGGTSTGDEVRISAANGAADLTNVTNVETITVLDNFSTGADTSLLIDTNFGDVNGQNFQLVDATALDSNEDFVLTATGNIHLDVNSGNGNDTITTNSGNDSIDGNDGNDVINAGSGNNVVNGGSGNDSITVGNGNDLVDGGTGNDTIFGGNGLNTLNGGDGNDEITGGDNVDVIDGGSGNDQIYAGLGNNAGAGDTLTGGTGNDTFYYVARAESSTSLSGRDVITDFQSGSDVIDFRYVAEAVAQYGAGALINFSGNAADFATAQGAITSGDGVLDVVFQQDNNVLWVDLNDDGVLNGNDLQIILQGTNALVGADVLSGLTVGQTVITPGANLVGTILPETFVFDPGFGPGDSFTLDGAGGTDTIVIDGQDISTSSLTNVEVARVDGSATMTVAQHNAFTDIEATLFDDTITLSNGGTLTGDADIQNYVLGGSSVFTLGANNQNVTGSASNDTIKTGLGNDVLVGTINGGAGANTLVLDAGDNVAGATVSNITTTVITGSSVTMTAAQHGTNGSNGLLGNIIDEGDAGPSTLNPGTTNTADTITLTTDAVGVTGIAAIERYELAGGNDSFTLGVGSQSVNGGAGDDTITAAAGNLTGSITGGLGSDVLVTVTGNNLTGALIDIEAIEINGVVTMTALQHASSTIQDTDASLDNVTIVNAGTVNAAANIETYTLQDNNLVPGISTLNVNAATTNVNVNGANTLAGTNVNVGGLTVNGTYTLLGSVGDTITATNGASIAGVNAGAATSAETLSLTGGITMTQVQHEAFGDIEAIGGADAATILGAGTVTAFDDVETYNVSSTGANTVVVNAGLTSVDINGDAANATTVNVGGLAVSGAYALANGADVLNTTNGADISGVNGGAATTAETINLTGDLSMTVAQHNGAAVNGLGGSDQVILVDGGAVTGSSSVEAYELANDAGNAFTFSATAGVADQKDVVSAGGNNNDTVITGLATDFTGVSLNLSGNSGLAGDTLVISTDLTNISGINVGAETTAETLNMDMIANVFMTVDQHEGFTAPFIAGGVNTVGITTGGTVNAEQAIETYSVSGIGANTVVVNALNTAVQVIGNMAFPTTVDVGGLTVTGTYALANGADVIVATNGADISGVNGGVNTTAEELQLTGGITMTVAQNEEFVGANGITAAGLADSVTFADVGNANADGSVESYVLAAAGGSTLTLVDTDGTPGEVTVDVAGAGGNDTVSVGDRIVAGTFALAGAADEIIAADGADLSGINGGAATTAEGLTFGGDITMTAVQYNAFNGADGFSGTGGPSDRVILSAADAVAVTIADSIETIQLTAASADQDLNQSAASDLVEILGLDVGGAYAFDGDDTLSATDGADISDVNAGAATTFGQLSLVGGITMTDAQHDDFVANSGIVAAGAADSVTITDAASIDAEADVEAYTLLADGNTINFTVGDNADHSVDISGGVAADLVSLTNAGVDDGADNSIEIAGFQVTVDTLNLNLAGSDFVTVGPNLNEVIAAGTDIIEVATGINVDLTDLVAVENLIANAVGDIDSGDYAIVVYSDNTATANAGIYYINTTAAGGDLTAANTTIEFAGFITNVGADNLATANFV